jgi:carbon storage regulator
VLVLTRNVGETVHLGEDIVVTVVEVRGNRVRLGFDAPRDGVPIERGELRARRLAEEQDNPDKEQ